MRNSMIGTSHISPEIETNYVDLMSGRGVVFCNTEYFSRFFFCFFHSLYLRTGDFRGFHFYDFLL